MEEGANKIEAFVIRDVGCGSLMAWFSIKVLNLSAESCPISKAPELACEVHVLIMVGATAALTVKVFRTMTYGDI